MRLHLFAFLPLVIASASLSAAATRSFTITGFDRIRVDGPYKVTLTNNVAPFARATGPLGALDRVSIEVQGRTLIVRPAVSAAAGNRSSQREGPVEIAVGTHELNQATVNGSGSLSIDKVRGLSFELSVQGAGGAKIQRIDVDRLKLWLSGSGSSTVAGKAATLTTSVLGTALLDAGGLTAKEATISVEGTSTVRLNVADSAKVNARGPAVVELGGRPSCTVRAEGSSEVTGCR